MKDLIADLFAGLVIVAWIAMIAGFFVSVAEQVP